MRLGSVLASMLLVAASACGDDDDATNVTPAIEETDGAGVDVDTARVGTTDVNVAATDVDDGATDATVAGTDGNDVTAAPSGGAAVGEIDVCALVTSEEIEAVIGMPAGSAQAEDAPAPFFGCRYEEDGLTQVVSVGVIAWGDPEEAEASFNFGADQYPAIEGIGDRAYNSQPIGDISVLAGRYEVSVSLFFVSDDDAAELGMARELAALVVDRLT